MFQAERQTTCSSYKLTLSGFSSAPSDCRAQCGDGILAIGEECDDGIDNGDTGYGGCSTECTLGEFCGDGVKNGDEMCDDGANNGLPGYCPSGCRYPRDSVGRSPSFTAEDTEETENAETGLCAHLGLCALNGYTRAPPCSTSASSAKSPTRSAPASASWAPTSTSMP